MKYLIFLILIFPSYAQSTPSLYSDTYSEHLQNPLELAWGDDAFFKVPESISLAEEDGTPERYPYLSAILYNGENSVAILDGQALSKGEMIYTRKVFEIGRNYVLLEKGSSVIELMVGKVKEPPPLLTEEQSGPQDNSMLSRIKQIGKGVMKILK